MKSLLEWDWLSMLGIVVNLLGGFLIWKVVGIFLVIGKKCLKQALLLFCCVLLNVMVIYVGDPVNLPPTIIIFLVGIIAFCEGGFISKITIGCMIANMALAFNALSDNYIPMYTIPYGVPRVIFWSLLFCLIRRYVPQKGYELAPSLWRLLLSLTMIPLGIVSTLVILINPQYVLGWQDERTKNMLWVCFVLLLIALFSNVGLIWTITILEKQTKLERQQFLEAASRNYYESVEAQQFEIRRLKHDMGNHLQTLHGLKDEKREEYLEGLIQNTVFRQTLQYCADATVNAVINAKIERMEQHAISFHVKAEIAKELPFEKPDICALLANVLDNAIEACCKLSKESRRIELDMNMQKGLFVIKARNPVLEKGIDETFQTTKKNKKEHGYGLQSIREIAERYDGKFELSVKEKQCQVLLYLPVRC